MKSSKSTDGNLHRVVGHISHRTNDVPTKITRQFKRRRRKKEKKKTRIRIINRSSFVFFEFVSHGKYVNRACLAQTTTTTAKQTSVTKATSTKAATVNQYK